MEYQQVKTRGQFDNQREVIIGPRSFIDAKGEAVGGGIISARDSRVGFLVVTPFILSETGDRILINRCVFVCLCVVFHVIYIHGLDYRGWIPRSKLDPDTRREGEVAGEVAVSGVLRLTEERSSLSPANEAAKNLWHSRDVEALAAKLNTRPVFLDLDLESSREAAGRGGPVGGQTRISLRNDHVQYMMTWWSVSAMTMLLWLKKFVL